MKTNGLIDITTTKESRIFEKQIGAASTNLITFAEKRIDRNT